MRLVEKCIKNSLYVFHIGQIQFRYTSLFISIILLYISLMTVSIHIGVAIAFPNFQRNEDNNWW